MRVDGMVWVTTTWEGKRGRKTCCKHSSRREDHGGRRYKGSDLGRDVGKVVRLRDRVVEPGGEAPGELSVASVSGHGADRLGRGRREASVTSPEESDRVQKEKHDVRIVGRFRRLALFGAIPESR